MKLEFSCPERWREALQKAHDLNDNTLFECVSRLVTYTTPWQWQVDNAKLERDKRFAKWRAADSLCDKFRGTEHEQRSISNCYRYYSKYSDANDRYMSVVDGGDLTAHISKDYTPFSFYFAVMDGKDRLVFNGGIIYSEHSHSWSIHT